MNSLKYYFQQRIKNRMRTRTCAHFYVKGKVLLFIHSFESLINQRSLFLDPKLSRI